MKSLFIPMELVSQFLASTKSFREWSDLKFLQSILSPLDGAFYINANIRATELVGSFLIESFPNELVCSSIDQKDVFAALNPETEKELRKLAAAKISSNGMFPTVLHFDGTHLFFTLSETAPECGVAEHVLNIVAPTIPFTVLATLPVFATYLADRQVKLQVANP